MYIYLKWNHNYSVDAYAPTKYLMSPNKMSTSQKGLHLPELLTKWSHGPPVTTDIVNVIRYPLQLMMMMAHTYGL